MQLLLYPYIAIICTGRTDDGATVRPLAGRLYDIKNITLIDTLVLHGIYDHNEAKFSITPHLECATLTLCMRTKLRNFRLNLRKRSH